MRTKLYIFKPFHFVMRLKYLTIDIISNSSWVFNATKGVSLAKYKSASLADCSYWKEAIAASKRKSTEIGRQCPWKHLAMPRISDIWCCTSVWIPPKNCNNFKRIQKVQKIGRQCPWEHLKWVTFDKWEVAPLVWLPIMALADISRTLSRAPIPGAKRYIKFVAFVEIFYPRI